MTPGDDRWRRPLPLQRAAFACGPKNSGQARQTTPATSVPVRREAAVDAPTCGHLFGAVQSFFQADRGLAVLRQALCRHLGRQVHPGDIGALDVLLIKHGEFYHPCRLEALIGEKRVPFVLNVAVSKVGLTQLETEYRALERLGRELPLGFLPRVYGRGEVGTPFPAAMFLAEWLAGFCEFHARRSTGDREPAIIIWDPDSRDRTLCGDPVGEIYRQAAAILATCYHPETFEHVHPWHHAAGDFVVRQENRDITVRLISVRSYVPLFQPPTDDSSADRRRLILEALLVFLLQLSIRMRIDRLKGVGDLVWIDDAVVPATVQGFFDGLATGCRQRGIPAKAVEVFGAYLSAVEAADLLSLCRQLVEVHLAPQEKALVKPHLERHSRLLHAALRPR